MSEQLEKLQATMRKLVPSIRHCAVLGIDVIEAEKGKLKLILPYSKSIIANPVTGAVGGGTLTTLMDTTCGFAAVMALDKFSLMPTLDLRIDYMSAGTPGVDIYGEAEAYKVTSNVIFCRGTAYHEGEKDNPIANCTATFMRLDASVTEKSWKRSAKGGE